MKRRTFLRAAGAAGVAAVAGCSGPAGDANTTVGTTTGTVAETRTLRVGTYEPFVDSPSVSPGPWLKDEFERAHDDVEIEWLTPDSGLNYFIQQQQYDDGVEADVYVGLNADDMVKVDAALPDAQLFDDLSGDAVAHRDDVDAALRFDPEGRAIPYDTGYISLVYDETPIDAPRTFDDLTKPAYEGTLLLQNAQTSDPGRAFLLWTIRNRGEDAYLDFWEALLENEARILGDWNAAYTAYSNEERPAVVSYSTDQVYAHRNNQDMARHQIAFLDDQGYAVPEGMARFADASHPDLAARFLDFVLSPRAQAEIAVRNVAFPANTATEPPATFADYAHRPPETVTHTYDELAGSLDGWVQSWAQTVADR